MTSIQERLQQLLDGELDPSEIADDPTLVSLADRLYGIKIAAVQPVKPRDATPSAPVPAAGSPTLSSTDLLVEVIGPAPGDPSGVPLPAVPPVELEMPPVPSKKSKNPLQWVFASGLVFTLLNLFGIFSSLFESACSTGIGSCRGPEQTRLNLMEFYKFGESDGWSYSLLSESMSGVAGTSGGLGIPDIVAVVVLLAGFLWMRKRG